MYIQFGPLPENQESPAQRQQQDNNFIWYRFDGLFEKTFNWNWTDGANCTVLEGADEGDTALWKQLGYPIYFDFH